MYDGMLILSNGTTEVFGPWVPREGDNGIFLIEVIASNNATLEVKLCHRRNAESGDGSEVSGFAITRTSDGRSIAEGLALLGRVRLKYKLTRTDGQNPAWAIVRAVKPCWFETLAVPGAGPDE